MSGYFGDISLAKSVFRKYWKNGCPSKLHLSLSFKYWTIGRIYASFQGYLSMSGSDNKTQVDLNGFLLVGQQKQQNVSIYSVSWLCWKLSEYISIAERKSSKETVLQSLSAWQGNIKLAKAIKTCFLTPRMRSNLPLDLGCTLGLMWVCGNWPWQLLHCI